MRCSLLLLLTACTGKGTETDSAGSAASVYDLPVGPYTATVQWTGYGVPHVTADDTGSAGYGIGYAQAKDHLCTIAEQVMTARSERSLYLGAGTDDVNIDTDFGWLQLNVMEQAESGFLGQDPTIQAAMVGFAAGYNRYLDEIGSDGLPTPCAGAAWVQPINHVELLATYLMLGESGSGAALITTIGQGQPPGAERRRPAPDASMLEPFREPRLGSNGWALGADRTADGGGMLLSNTHFPYEGEKRWYEHHVRVGDDIDLYGASLAGVLFVNLGFNRHVAWTHTVSNTPRFTMYLLTLDPSDPTRYEYDGAMVDMSARDFTIEVLSDDGTTSTVSRTLYRSQQGPVINAPVLGWSSAVAVAMQDANSCNLQMAPTWLGMGAATTLDDFIAAQSTHQGIPWVHTLAADETGRAWYADSAAAPNLSDAALAAWKAEAETNYLTQTFAGYGVIALDGSDPFFAWVEEDGARAPGLVPFERAPQLERSDFVANANDNYWLVNPDAPLTGYSAIYGDPATVRSARTRVNLLSASETGPDSFSGEDGLFDLDELLGAAVSGRAMMAEQLREAVVSRCTDAAPQTVTIDGTSHEVDLTEACATLSAWDGSATLDARGNVLWREFLGGGTWDTEDFEAQGDLWANDFDPDDPLNTPNTLAAAPKSGSDPVLTALATAVVLLDTAGVALDASLREVQYQIKGDERHAVMGGQQVEGVMAMAGWSSTSNTAATRVERGDVVNSTTDLTEDGYPVNYGNSFILGVSFTSTGPVAKSVMTYSQSMDPDSSHFADQSALYANGGFKDVAYEEADILADPDLVTEELTLE
jgi:acyl-homoserine-lactone acylase